MVIYAQVKLGKTPKHWNICKWIKGGCDEDNRRVSVTSVQYKYLLITVGVTQPELCTTGPHKDTRVLNCSHWGSSAKKPHLNLIQDHVEVVQINTEQSRFHRIYVVYTVMKKTHESHDWTKTPALARFVCGVNAASVQTGPGPGDRLKSGAKDFWSGFCLMLHWGVLGPNVNLFLVPFQFRWNTSCILLICLCKNTFVLFKLWGLGNPDKSMF